MRGPPVFDISGFQNWWFRPGKKSFKTWKRPFPGLLKEVQCLSHISANILFSVKWHSELFPLLPKTALLTTKIVKKSLEKIVPIGKGGPVEELYFFILTLFTISCSGHF